MKKMLLTLMLLGVMSSASAQLTTAQQAQVKEWFTYHGPQAIDAAARDKLVTLRADLQRFYADVAKPTLLTKKQLDELSKEERDSYNITCKDTSKEYQDLQRPALLKLCERHGLTLVHDGHSFVLLMRVKNNWWVIRMRRMGFPLPFQTLSRIGYVHQIQQEIADNNLTTIIPPQAYFYNMHGIQSYDENNPQTAFNDDNWFIVEPYRVGLPSADENLLRFQDLDKKSEAIEQLRTLINKAGLWDIAANKLFITWERLDGVYVPVVTLVDIEMPGLGGATESNFFHRSQKEIAGNAQVGAEELEKLLKRPSWFWRHRYELGGVASLLVLGGAWMKWGPRIRTAQA